MMPALQMIASSLSPRDWTAATHARTEAGDDSSHPMGTISFPRAAVAARAFSSVLAAAMTRAPRLPRTRTVSSPIPELHPVTKMVRPVRSRPAVTSSAVEAPPKPLGPFRRMFVRSDIDPLAPSRSLRSYDRANHAQLGRGRKRPIGSAPSQLGVAAGHHEGVVGAGDGEHAPARELRHTGEGDVVPLRADRPEHGEVRATNAPRAWAVLENAFVELAPRFVSGCQDGDAKAHGALGAGAADVQVHEIGARSLDAHVDVLPFEKTDDAPFVEMPVIGAQLVGIAETGLEADSVEIRRRGAAAPMANEAVPIRSAGHAQGRAAAPDGAEGCRENEPREEAMNGAHSSLRPVLTSSARWKEPLYDAAIRAAPSLVGTSVKWRTAAHRCHAVRTLVGSPGFATSPPFLDDLRVPHGLRRYVGECHAQPD